MNPVHLILGFVVVAGVSALAVGAVRGYAIEHAMFDVPNERSSHNRAVPLGGGTVIAGAWFVCLAALASIGAVEVRPAVALAGGLAVAAVGWLDDRREVSTALRLIAHLAAAGWTVGWLGGGFALDFGTADVSLGPLGPVLATLGLVWLTNLYNFMDGIDGLAASETVVAGGAIAALLWAAGAPGLAALTVALAGASLGFLAWNRPPAKIFMGDVGSGLIGYALGAVVLAAGRDPGVPIPLLLIPLAVFVCDATFTLVRRLVRGERVYEAHRTHVYQRLIARGWSHGRVTGLVVAIDLVLAGLAWWASGAADRIPPAIAVALAGTVAAGAAALMVAGHTGSKRAGESAQ